MTAKAEFDDSLSSLSIESEDETNLLTQAIAAGFNKKSEAINIPKHQKQQHQEKVANDSISSVDSCDKDEATNSILEQCIQSGINQVVKKDSSTKRPVITSSPKKSMLPTFRPSSASSSSNLQQAGIKKKSEDEDLLKECIATGMMMTTTKQQVNLIQNLAQLSITDSKNGETTSVIVLEECHNAPHASVTGVDTIIALNIEKNTNSNNKDHLVKDPVVDENTELEKETWMTKNGCSSNFEWILDDNILERSNEYPANKLAMMLACSGGDIDDDSNMEMSNEFMMEENEEKSKIIEDKHKNPDLMLKSVDRLTQELVSTAEYLRKNTEVDKMSNSISNNTWNDEISFPSISMSAPMIGSTNDEATFAIDPPQPIPEEEVIDGNCMSNSNDLNEKTPTNEDFKFKPKEENEEIKIDFKVGGEIGSGAKSKINIFSNGPASMETCSTMSNSTIVQTEARKIVNKLLMEGSATSLLDLENVRPPSSMDSISLCSYNDLSVLQSPSKNQLQKKSLITGKFF